VKIGPVDPEIFDQICSFLAILYQKFTNELCQLWSFWTEFHQIFTRYTGIICAVNVHTDVAISHSVSECPSDESGEFAIFSQNRLPWQRPLTYRKRGPDRSSASNMLSFGEKIANIGLTDPKIFVSEKLLKKIIKIKRKKKEINASKICSPIGNLAERAKQQY